MTILDASPAVRRAILREERLSWGRWLDSPKLDHITPSLARLLEDFHFVARDGYVWTADKGMVFDGTSIPSLLWTAFRESPFTGHASWAAVIHDAGCKGIVRVEGERRAEAGFRDPLVHARFYDAIRASGGSAVKAWAFYRGVWTYGMVRGGRSVAPVA